MSLYGTELYPGGEAEESGAPAEHLALLESARLDLLASDGRVVWERRGISSPLHWISVPDGEYTVRLAVPGRAIAERRVSVRVGAFTNVSFSEE